MSPKHQQIIDKVRQCIDIGNRTYGMQMPYFEISFNLKGRVAGWAQVTGLRSGVPVYSVRFNNDMITRGDEEVFNDMLNDTVPHEVAHCFCFANPRLGRNHDGGWQRVCITLGGTGIRTHDNEVVYGKGTTYEYTTDRGHKVRVGDKHHSHIQRGGLVQFRKGKGTVTQHCAYSIVGVNGRTLVNPVVKPATVPEGALCAVPPAVPTPAYVPVAPLVNRVQPPVPGESKAAVSRRIMLAGYRGGQSYETIIAAMQKANGYDRQLARATFKANQAKCGIPESFGK